MPKLIKRMHFSISLYEGVGCVKMSIKDLFFSAKSSISFSEIFSKSIFVAS